MTRTEQKIKVIMELIDHESEHAQDGHTQTALDFCYCMLEDLLAGGRQTPEKFAAWIHSEYGDWFGRK